MLVDLFAQLVCQFTTHRILASRNLHPESKSYERQLLTLPPAQISHFSTAGSNIAPAGRASPCRTKIFAYLGPPCCFGCQELLRIPKQPAWYVRPIQGKEFLRNGLSRFTGDMAGEVLVGWESGGCALRFGATESSSW